MIPVTFERASLSSRTSFVHRRSEKRSEGSAANSYSPRSVSGRVNGMMPTAAAAVRIPYAPVHGGGPDESSLAVAIRAVDHPTIVPRACRVCTLLGCVFTTAEPRILRHRILSISKLELLKFKSYCSRASSETVK